MGVDLGNDIKDVSKKVTSYKEYKEFGREDNGPTPEQLILDI